MPEIIGSIWEFIQLITGILGGDNSVLSTDGSLAGDETAGEIDGSLVGSIVGSLGIEDELPGTLPQLIGSLGEEVVG